MASSLKTLVDIISSGVAKLDTIYTEHKVEFPSLDEPYRQTPVHDVAALEVTQMVIAAAYQLISTVREPSVTIVESISAAQITGNTGVINELNIPEILATAGPQGMHISEIGKLARTDAGKLGRILRHLATRHIFREVSPDYFANNRISSVLDSRKSIDELRANPEAKWDTDIGLQALASFIADEGLNWEPHMIPYMLDPATAGSQEPYVCPLNLAYGTKLPQFEWYDQPGNERRHRRFGFAMQSANHWVPADSLTKGFDWNSLKDGALVVDVGGGIGDASMQLAKAYPHLKFVIQDRPTVILTAESHWKEKAPEILAQGRVSLQVHDFFTPQPIKNADVFFIRLLIHDWPDAYARKIYTHLRASATPTTYLVHLEAIIPYAAPLGKDKKLAQIPGALQQEAPAPLLPNGGAASALLYMADMQMLRVLNGQERTVGQWVDLVDGTGWKLDRIHRISGGHLSHIVFVPI